jgi:hypothetical protein
MDHFGMNRRDCLRFGALRRINAARSLEGRQALSSFAELAKKRRTPCCGMPPR